MQQNHVQQLIDTQATLRMILKEEKISQDLEMCYKFVIGHIKTITPDFQNTK
ncbi:hypothetical protein [Jeotgalibacillus soli]|uniref:Uncharacterized protein n=1 Tax=Jeotgalibacillus soli TaxID=889306 RepID=A0A0C2S7Q5_9BACL|nr:hypothetical protein [Jeotgalibacillus soli]KIL50019.1 hypothetical protein KP78_14870 [Jeotgalibacillus soli]